MTTSRPQFKNKSRRNVFFCWQLPYYEMILGGDLFSPSVFLSFCHHHILQSINNPWFRQIVQSSCVMEILNDKIRYLGHHKDVVRKKNVSKAYQEKNTKLPCFPQIRGCGEKSEWKSDKSETDFLVRRTLFQFETVFRTAL